MNVPPRDPHLDDEHLSAALDGGRLSPAQGLHLQQCPACTSRQRALARAAGAVARPVERLDPAVMDSWVARAAGEAPVPASAGPAEISAPQPPTIVDLRDRYPVPRRGSAPNGVGANRSGRRRTAPPLAWLVGAAAGLALLAGVGGVLRASNSTDRTASVASETVAGESSDARTPAAPTDTAGWAGDNDQSPPPIADATDRSAVRGAGPDVVVANLGDFDDPTRLVAALGGPAVDNSLSAAPAAPAAGIVEHQTGDPQSEAASAAAAGSFGGGGEAECVDAARQIGAGNLGAHLSTVTIRWKGIPAEVLVFALTEPAGGVTRHALVLRRPGCDLLADPRF